MSSQSSHPNSEAEKLINDDVTEILQKLTAAVQAGEKEQAAALVTELADLKLKLDINIPKEDQEQRSKEKEFSVRVHVEDRVSDGCYFNLKVKACDTVHDLKKKVMLKHNFPMEVQRWIVGKRFLVDKDRIGQCGIKKSGHTLYLYLVTARSVELTRQDYEARRQAMLDGRPLPMSQNSQPGGLSPVNKDSTFMLRSLWQPSELDGGYNPAELSPSPNYGMDEVESGLPHGPSRQTSKKSLSSGSSFLQGMLQSIPQTQNDALPAGVRQRSVSSDNSGGQGMDSPANDRTSPSSYRSVTPPHSPAHDTRVVENPGWYCTACTFLNLPTRPGCEMCSTPRPTNYHVPSGYQMTQKEKEQLENDQRLEKLTREAEERTIQQNYLNLLATDEMDLIPNPEEFECAICFSYVAAGQGIMLRECLHMFCKDCLAEAVRHCDDAILKCPYQDDDYACESNLQEREIRALVPPALYHKFLQRGLDQVESQTSNSYHCKTADCPGWCIYEDFVNFFLCPVCGEENCLTCKAIHTGSNCKQYQDDLRLRAANDESAKKTSDLLESLVASGEAMYCPQCRVVVQKKSGCDWIMCSICKTEICWVTKGPRWGPMGAGDTSGGCGCRVNNQKCHPKCCNCH